MLVHDKRGIGDLKNGHDPRRNIKRRADVAHHLQRLNQLGVTRITLQPSPIRNPRRGRLCEISQGERQQHDSGAVRDVPQDGAVRGGLPIKREHEAVAQFDEENDKDDVGQVLEQVACEAEVALGADDTADFVVGVVGGIVVAQVVLPRVEDYVGDVCGDDAAEGAASKIPLASYFSLYGATFPKHI